MWIARSLTVCVPSSRLINSFEKVRPGIKPRFFNQKTAAKDPEKKMPSTQAKPISRVRKGWKPHSQLFMRQGMAETHELGCDVFQRPVCLLLDTRDCISSANLSEPYLEETHCSPSP